VERVLAISRLFVALMSLAAWLLRLGNAASRYQLGLILLLAYVAASVALLLRLQFGATPGPKFSTWAQINDVGWPAVLCLWVETPGSVFFTLFLFAIIAAAFRWGFIQTLTTAVISSALLLFQALILTHNPSLFPGWQLASIQPSRLILRCAFLLMAGTLVGFLADTEKQLRAEISVSNHLLSLARVGNRFSSALQSVLVELAKVFRGDSVYEVVAQGSSGRVFKWEIPSLERPSIGMLELAPADQKHEVLAEYPHTFFMRRNGSAGRPFAIALDEEGRRLDSSQVKDLPMPVANADSVLVVSHEMGRDWCGRFVLLNARLGMHRERQLRFAQTVLRQVAPALYSVYLFRAFRSRAEVTERARVARELHDTAIQSLISIEMQMDVLRRSSMDSGTTVELERIQGLLQQEVLNLRELMQSMRPVDIGPHQFLDFVAGIVERFSRDTGIAVRFISELQEITLPASTCREMARVVQEGLVNIRKHSGAQSAVVRFGSQNGSLKLVINDDGRGFPFSGRLSLGELDSYRRGPTVIKERVRAVGGDMVIESTPGHGSKLEITIPKKGYESYGY
jgi:signal transduction histidine kinase